MIKDSSGATSWSLSPPVHLEQPVAALSRAEEGWQRWRDKEGRDTRALTKYYDLNKGGFARSLQETHVHPS